MVNWNLIRCWETMKTRPNVTYVEDFVVNNILNVNESKDIELK